MASPYEKIREKLVAERDHLRHQLVELGVDPDTGNPTDHDFDHNFADSGASTAEKNEVLAIADTHKQSLDETLAAMAAIDDGTYGKCDRCGEEISLERLEARPRSLRCVDCKEKYG